MSPFEPLQFDERGSSYVIADTRTIALIASKKKFNIEKEKKLLLKAKHYSSICRCKHFTGTNPCLYRNCRHFAEMHYKGASTTVVFYRDR